MLHVLPATAPALLPDSNGPPSKKPKKSSYTAHPLPTDAHGTPSPSLRICCLLPSATETIGRLGLASHLTCVTHCCDFCPDMETLDDLLSTGAVARVTSSFVRPDVLSQHDIDEMVKGTFKAGKALYGIDTDMLAKQKPTLVITQGLCDVCAPTEQQATAACADMGGEEAEASAGTVAGADGGAEQGHEAAGGKQGGPHIISVSPQSLSELADSFVTVGEACGVAQRGQYLKDQFLGDLTRIHSAVQPLLEATGGGSVAGKGAGAEEATRVFVLEWMDPPFDAGHWVPEIIQIALGNAAGSSCAAALLSSAPGDDTTTSAPWTGSTKSKQRTWEEVQEEDPDVLIVCGCGFDLQRNSSDAEVILREHPVASQLRAVQCGRVFALDGNRTLSRPGPCLVEGTAAVAACVWQGDAQRMAALHATGCLPEEGVVWGRLQV